MNGSHNIPRVSSGDIKGSCCRGNYSHPQEAQSKRIATEDDQRNSSDGRTTSHIGPGKQINYSIMISMYVGPYAFVFELFYILH